LAPRGSKVSPSGRNTFMLQYRNFDGRKRKPAIGLFGELTVEQARSIAQRWMAEVREGKDPSLARIKKLRSLTIAAFSQIYYDRHTVKKTKPRTQ